MGLRDIRFCRVAQLVALVLLKTQMVLDLEAMESGSVPRSPIIAGNPDLLDQQNRAMAKYNVELQAYTLYTVVHSLNLHIWPVLYNPQPHIAQRPPMFSPGSLEQARLILAYSYRAWVETRGALELTRERVVSGEWTLTPDSMRPRLPTVFQMRTACAY